MTETKSSAAHGKIQCDFCKQFVPEIASVTISYINARQVRFLICKLEALALERELIEKFDKQS